MTTNYDKYFGTPEDAAKNLRAFILIDRQNPVIESYSKFRATKTYEERQRNNEKITLEWLQDECDE